MRLYWILAGLVLFLLLPSLIWGAGLGAVSTVQGSTSWLGGFGTWGVLAGVLLLISNLVLPVPATVVMAALGILYGPVVGGLAAAAGSFASGFAAYVVCDALGRPAAEHVVDDAEFEKGEAFFERWGGWMVALSRWLPIVSEVVACMAGLVRMPLRMFSVALACGVVPLGCTFALAGHLGAERPVLTLLVSALAPAILWGVVRPWVDRSVRSETGVAR